jgi:hypothetical protein
MEIAIKRMEIEVGLRVNSAVKMDKRSGVLDQ